MAKTCNKCKTEIEITAENQNLSVPFVVHQTSMARQERQIKRMWIALIVAVALIFASNAIWLWGWLQYDYESYSYDVSADGDSNANFIGQDGNIYNGGTNSGEAENPKEEE